MTHRSTVSVDARRIAWLRLGVWLLGLTIALWQAVVYRNWINADTVSYLDMSDGVRTGDWGRLVNASWSPLYPTLIGVLSALLKPAPASEFGVAHAMNFLSFVFAFACFEVLMRAIDAVMRRRSQAGDTALPLPRWALYTIGYSLFLCGSLGLLTLMKPTPDMLMSGFLYLSLASLVSIVNGHDGWRMYIALGATLGLGYLAKTIMFPLGVIMLGASLIRRGPIADRIAKAAVAGVIVLVLGSPLIVPLSRRMKHLTVGEAGPTTRLMWIDRFDLYTGRGAPANGKPDHTPTSIFADPAAYSFDHHMAVTQQFWFDPTYWTTGARSAAPLRRQARVIFNSAMIYLRILRQLGLAIVALVALFFLAGLAGTGNAARAFWPLSVVAIMALGAYATVHVEERYVGAFFALVALALFCGIRLPAGTSQRVASVVVAAVVVNLAFYTGRQMRRDYNDENVSKINIGDADAAAALRLLGIAPGDHVARINPRVADGWARLARVSIIAEVRPSQAARFWSAPPETQAALLHAFADAGAKAVVSYSYPRRNDLPSGWVRLGGTNYSAMLLQSGSARAP